MFTITNSHTESKLGASNLDCVIDDGLSEALKAGKVFGQHSAWNFCGYMYWDGENFCNEIWIHGSPRDTLKHETLQGVFELARTIYGEA